MSKPLTMTEEREAEARFAATGGANCSVGADRVGELLAEVDALRAALAAAEAKLADERRQLTAALEAERLHADALADGHRVVCAEGGRGNRDAALNCMETATRLLAAHAARRAAAAPLSDAGASSEVANG